MLLETSLIDIGNESQSLLTSYFVFEHAPYHIIANFHNLKESFVCFISKKKIMDTVKARHYSEHSFQGLRFLPVKSNSVYASKVSTIEMMHLLYFI